jgi:Fumarylacetoacetate (FAA) hydrolase family
LKTIATPEGRVRIDLTTGALQRLAEREVRYLAPISGIRQIPATGFNYKKHIEEMKVPTPTEPEVFLKSMFSLTGPFDPISRGPNRGVKLDWETELAIVVGREVQDITAEEAAGYIFGYVCLNDVSDRNLFGSIRQGIPLRSTKIMPARQARSVRRGGRPDDGNPIPLGRLKAWHSLSFVLPPLRRGPTKEANNRGSYLRWRKEDAFCVFCYCECCGADGLLSDGAVDVCKYCGRRA